MRMNRKQLMPQSQYKERRPEYSARFMRQLKIVIVIENWTCQICASKRTRSGHLTDVIFHIIVTKCFSK